MLFNNQVVSTIIKQNVHTTFYNSSRLTRNLTFNGVIYYKFVGMFEDTAFLLTGAEW